MSIASHSISFYFDKNRPPQVQYIYTIRRFYVGAMSGCLADMYQEPNYGSLVMCLPVSMLTATITPFVHSKVLYIACTWSAFQMNEKNLLENF